MCTIIDARFGPAGADVDGHAVDELIGEGTGEKSGIEGAVSREAGPRPEARSAAPSAGSPARTPGRRQPESPDRPRGPPVRRTRPESGTSSSATRVRSAASVGPARRRVIAVLTGDTGELEATIGPGTDTSSGWSGGWTPAAARAGGGGARPAHGRRGSPAPTVASRVWTHLPKHSTPGSTPSGRPSTPWCRRTGVPGTDVDTAEGYRWVTRLSTLGPRVAGREVRPAPPPALPAPGRVPQAPRGQSRRQLPLLRPR